MALESSVAEGISNLYELGSVVSVLVLAIIVLIIDRRDMKKTITSQRDEYNQKQEAHMERYILMQEKTIDAMNSFKEVLRDVGRK